MRNIIPYVEEYLSAARMKGNGGFYRYAFRRRGKTKYHVLVGLHNNRDLVDELTRIAIDHRIWRNRWLLISGGVGNDAEEFAVWILRNMFANVDTRSYYVDKYSKGVDEVLIREGVSPELIYLEKVVDKYGSDGNAEVEELIKVREIMDHREEIALKLMVDKTNRLLELGRKYDHVVLIITYGVKAEKGHILKI